MNAVEAWLEGPGGPLALSSHRYAPGVVHPDGAAHLVAFEHEPWPRWTFDAGGGHAVEHELFVPHGMPAVVLSWRLIGPAGAAPDGAWRGARLSVRPLLSGRDLHALHFENADFRFGVQRRGERLRFEPYPAVPAVGALATGPFVEEPLWFRRFLYAEERARGFEHVEDLASPGRFELELDSGEAHLVLWAEPAGAGPPELPGDGTARGAAAALADRERRRRAAFATPLDRAADAYLVRRGAGRSVIAGYPWFTDWGRDTFLALRGLCLATGRLDEAGEVLGQWAGLVSEGMLPNRFLDGPGEPEFNSADASLWFAVAAGELLAAARRRRRPPSPPLREALREAVLAILEGYARGTRFGIQVAPDGLLAAGARGWQLTWMDARVGEREITPRTGKPVELQALWVNALAVGEDLARGAAARRWRALRERALEAFSARFWNASAGALHDVVDEDHEPGRVDPSLRPNQVYAVGGLPLALLEGARARSVVDVVEHELWTPLGLRSLAPSDPRYVGRYEGGPGERDAAYHQGTVWPFLAGPFVEAWVRVRGSTPRAVRAARRRFLRPLLAHLTEAGLGHVSEIADGDAPHAPRGAPFQAWSLGELLRLDRVVLAGAAAPARPRARAPRRAR